MSTPEEHFQLAMDDMKSAGLMGVLNNARPLLKALGLKTAAEVRRTIIEVAEQAAYDTRYDAYSGPEYYAEAWE